MDNKFSSRIVTYIIVGIILLAISGYFIWRDFENKKQKAVEEKMAYPKESAPAVKQLQGPSLEVPVLSEKERKAVMSSLLGPSLEAQKEIDAQNKIKK